MAAAITCPVLDMMFGEHEPLGLEIAGVGRWRMRASSHSVS
jgi:hypothetical protein